MLARDTSRQSQADLRDPDLAWLCEQIHSSGLKTWEIVERVANLSNGSVWISDTTIDNWLKGKTRRPQNWTLTWVSRALGFERRFVILGKR